MKEIKESFDYMVVCLNMETNEMFEIGKNTYELNLFKKKCNYSKKIKILGVVKNY